MVGKNGCWNALCVCFNCGPDSTMHIDASGQCFNQAPGDSEPTMGEKLLTANELRGLPTLCVGQADDLKIVEDDQRIWLSRCGVEDGEPYADKVTVEELHDGRWVTTVEYAG